MTVLVTGDQGFVGSKICERADVVGLSTLSGTAVDLVDPASLETALKGRDFTAVIHLAAQTFVPESFKDAKGTYDVNFLGTHNLLTALKAAGFKGRFLYVSSADVYGILEESELPATENTALSPLNPYAVSKIAAESLCRYWHLAEGTDVVIARPFNHIGPGQSPRFALADFSKAIVEIRKQQRDSVLSVGDLDVTRDFTDFRDVIEAYFLLLQHGVRGETYNICSGIERHLGVAVETLAALANAKITMAVDPARLRKSGQRRASGSPAKLQSQTGWRQKIEWEQSLKDMLAYWETAKQ